MRGFDTHIHTTFSDGLWSLEQIIRESQQIGLDGIAITDHDTVEGLPLAMQLSATMDFPVIPGIELSTEWEDKDIHILGYWFDYQLPWFQERLWELQNARRTRAQVIVEKLASFGLPLDLPNILASAGESIGRPHIAQAMVKAGYVRTVKEAFVYWLGRGCKAFAPRVKFSPFEAVDALLRAGGVPVLAHPGMSISDTMMRDLIGMGLGGIEVYHSDHNKNLERKYLAIANSNQLAVLGGSDFHGAPNGLTLGCKTTSLVQLEFLARKREMIK